MRLVRLPFLLGVRVIEVCLLRNGVSYRRVFTTERNLLLMGVYYRTVCITERCLLWKGICY